MTIVCEKCGCEYGVGDFPFCKGGHGRGANGVIPDDIPGGLEIRHGLCAPDGSPRKFYSKSEIARAAKEAGMTNYVEHKGSQGSDKSKHTSRWI